MGLVPWDPRGFLAGSEAIGTFFKFFSWWKNQMVRSIEKYRNISCIYIYIYIYTIYIYTVYICIYYNYIHCIYCMDVYGCLLFAPVHFAVKICQDCRLNPFFQRAGCAKRVLGQVGFRTSSRQMMLEHQMRNAALRRANYILATPPG